MWIDDQVLRNYREPFTAKIFVPDSTMVVLGSGNDEHSEVNLPHCEASRIPVLRRYGGGGTVVLYPGCVVVSAGCWVSDPYNNSQYFKLLNQAVIDALAAGDASLAGLSQAGISDITSGEKKIGGTSMFRSRNYLLYQASLLVSLDMDLIKSTLRHPTKEPDYRKGRKHEDFLTCLASVSNAKITAAHAAEILSAQFESAARQRLAQTLIAPVESQMPALQSRLDRHLE
jgi:lipoate-protein ligase A